MSKSMEFKGGELFADVPIDKIKPCDRNYLNHESNRAHIKASLERFGYRKASVVVDENFELLAGHGVVDALKDAGRTTVPVVVVAKGMTEDEKRAYRIADNESGAGAEKIWSIYEEEIKHLIGEFDMESFGVNTDFMNIATGGDDFSPDPSGSTRLDQKKTVVCPECGHEFEN